MFDHVGVNVRDLQKSKAFYEQALKVLGFKTLSEWENEAVGFGVEQPTFWIAKADDKHPHSTGVHIAFIADRRDVVDTFYKDALAADGKDNGAPGLRPQYHKDYYGAFVYDLDGNNIEVVCHAPEENS